MPHTTLVAAADLAALDPARVVVVDASFDLADTDAGRRAYDEAHVPGSLYAHLDHDLSGPKTGTNGRHPLPDRAAFAAWMARSGIGPGTQVVALDRQGGVYAARLWWLLRWMGHEAVAVLDGGWQAWQRDVGGVESGADARTREARETATAASPPSMPTIDAAALERALGRVALVDARAGERFRGEVEPLDRVAGHIPGAANRPFQANLRAGRFKPADALRAEWLALLGETPAGDVVHSCGSGVTACHNLLAMTHAGLPGSLLYPGSWSEWSADPARPVARG